MPFQSASWSNSSSEITRHLSFERPASLKEEMQEFYEEFDAGSSNPRQHTGIFEGSALSGVIMMADKRFDWGSLPASAGKSWPSGGWVQQPR